MLKHQPTEILKYVYAFIICWQPQKTQVFMIKPHDESKLITGNFPQEVNINVNIEKIYINIYAWL